MYQSDRAQKDAGDDFGPPLARSDLAALRAAGANWVALSVPGTWHVRSRAPWPEARAHLERLVSWAADEGLFVTVAVRTGPGRGEGDLIGAGLRDRSVFTSADDQAAWSKMWSEIAASLRHRRHVVGYELLVEPHDVDPPTWRAFAERLVRDVRAVDADTPILVGLPPWSSTRALDDTAPLTGSAVAYCAHQYEPHAYTHAEGQSDFSHEEVTASLARVASFARRTGAPVVVSEWGAAMGQPRVDRFFAAHLDGLERLGVDHAVWLWEVADRGGYPKFDVRRSPSALALLRATWSRNVAYATDCR